MKQFDVKALGVEEMTEKEQELINGGDGSGWLVLFVLLGVLVWGLITGDIEAGPYEDPEPMPFPEYM